MLKEKLSKMKNRTKTMSNEASRQAFYQRFEVNVTNHETRTVFFRPRYQIRASRPIPTWAEVKNVVFNSTSEEDSTTDVAISKNDNGGDMWAASANPDDYPHCDNARRL